MNGGRDYIVEYQTGQFQRGSLVLRFDEDPSDMQLRDALIRQGLPARALDQVSARPLETGRMWEAAQRRPTPATGVGTAVNTPPPTKTTPRKRNRWGTLFILLILFSAQMTRSGDAIDQGEAAAQLRGEQSCLSQLDHARAAADPEDGIIGGLFATAPTAFPLTPANAAFLLACQAAALE